MVHLFVILYGWTKPKFYMFCISTSKRVPRPHSLQSSFLAIYHFLLQKELLRRHHLSLVLDQLIPWIWLVRVMAWWKFECNVVFVLFMVKCYDNKMAKSPFSLIIHPLVEPQVANKQKIIIINKTCIRLIKASCC